MTDPIYFANGLQVGPPPVTLKKTITWVGKIKSAHLQVDFAQQGPTGLLDAIIPGWKMKTVKLNNKEYDAAQLVQFDDKPEPNRLVIEVSDALINGDNTLNLQYDAPPIAWAGGTAPLTVVLYIIAEVAPGIETPVLDTPSLNLIGENINKALSQATWPTIIGLAVIAAIVIAIAVIVSKVGVFFA